ncbi:MAG: CHAT domain-containing protein [Rhodobacteraceae bacterium]|nr:CHAT domain-containing protein [Paracoccaceae bacterium]MBR9823967.1 CHAT domain-containing protein [Paracoccaceae bacterium]
MEQIDAIDLNVIECEGRLTANLRFGELVISGVALPILPDGTIGNLRWLLEDYPRLPPGVADFAADEVEERLTAFGKELGACLDPVLKLAQEHGISYERLQLRISDKGGYTRHWPWELITTEDGPLGLTFGAIMRRPAVHSGHLPSGSTQRRNDTQHPLRVLYVIARPRSTEDVPFRSIASRVLSAIEGTTFQLDILRPPTIEALEESLASAKEAGSPYDVVHFDGHGELVETMIGQRGVILFERGLRGEARRVDARHIAGILKNGAVRALVLNACHSGGTPIIQPDLEEETSQSLAVASFAEEVAAAASLDVVAMSHAVFVNTAGHIVGDIFGCLSKGTPLSQAVRYARRRWSAGMASRNANIGYAIIRTFGQGAMQPSTGALPPYNPFKIDSSATPAHPNLPKVFQGPPRLLGTDNTVLSLEKALALGGHVVMTGIRGAGRTSMLLEFGRWLAATRFVQADRIGYLDFGTADDAEHALDILASDRSRVLLVDHAECIHGSHLMAQPGWEPDLLERLAHVLDTAHGESRQVVFTAHAPIFDAGNLTTLPIRPLELDEILDLAGDFVEETGARVALLWTAGHPGSLNILRRYAREDWFIDAKRTLSLLKELSSGLFIEVQPPLEEMTPLLISNVMAISSDDIAPLWLFCQFQGRFVFPHFSYGVDHAARSFRGSYLAIFDAENRPVSLLTKLQEAGLIAWQGPESLWLHPLLPCIVPTPYTANFHRNSDGRTALINISTFFPICWFGPTLIDRTRSQVRKDAIRPGLGGSRLCYGGGRSFQESWS